MSASECSCQHGSEKEKLNCQNALLNMIAEKEKQLREEFESQLSKEKEYLKERFDFILRNEETRTAFMLREAYRERNEKIAALKTQLECKNMAGLMYVMCAERRRSKLEKLQIVEKYTNYINAVNNILTEGQKVIIDLSRGYKTAARVNFEWQQKMKKVLTEFQHFINNFTGGTPEANQYFFDMQAMLNCKAPLEDNPLEDPIEEEETEEIEDTDNRKKTWWEKLDPEDKRPFIMLGDMSHFTPPVRREMIRKVKAQKTAPRKWKEYVFHEMFLQSNCPKVDELKDEYLRTISPPPRDIDCQMLVAVDDVPELEARRATAGSMDVKHTMGSILKIVTAGINPTSQNRAAPALLGVRDSMEIQSTTKLRDALRKNKNRKSNHNQKKVITVGQRKTSFYDEVYSEDEDSEDGVKERHESLTTHEVDLLEDVNHEKVCPIETCKRLEVDSFMQHLPAYMRSSPYARFEQNFEDYETCSPEQLEVLRKQQEEKKMKEEEEKKKKEGEHLESVEEWIPKQMAVMTQTSNLNLKEGQLPPLNCTCKEQNVQDPASTPLGYSVTNLIPMKVIIDHVKEEYLFKDQIQFNRFKLIGQESHESIRKQKLQKPQETPKEFADKRMVEIKKILKQHPSLCELFQANTFP